MSYFMHTCVGVDQSAAWSFKATMFYDSRVSSCCSDDCLSRAVKLVDFRSSTTEDFEHVICHDWPHGFALEPYLEPLQATVCQPKMSKTSLNVVATEICYHLGSRDMPGVLHRTALLK